MPRGVAASGVEAFQMSEAWAEAAEVRRDGGVLASRDACSAAAK